MSISSFPQVKTRKTEDITVQFAFSRRFYRKQLTVHSGYTVYHYVFPGFEPTTFCAANAMLYHWATGTHALKKHLSTTEAGIYLLTELIITLSVVPQGCVQPRQNGAKRLLNGNGGALNTLFWWRKCCNYGSWRGHSLSSFWIIFGAWWNKYAFNTEKYTRCYSHFPCRPE